MTRDYVWFDTETLGVSRVAEGNEIITLQKMLVNDLDSLQILSSWEFGGEKQLLEQIFEPEVSWPISALLYPENNDEMWDHIPVGSNLIGFDLLNLNSRLKFHKLTLIAKDLSAWYSTRPYIDVKSVCVMLNGGFKEWSRFMKSRVTQNSQVPELYRLKHYEQIESYIAGEAKEFQAFWIKWWGKEHV